MAALKRCRDPDYRQRAVVVRDRRGKMVCALQGDLAAASGVSEPTIARLESEDGPVGGRAETGEKLVAALEKAGGEFIAENGGGAGVRLKKRSSVPKKPK